MTTSIKKYKKNAFFSVFLDFWYYRVVYSGNFSLESVSASP